MDLPECTRKPIGYLTRKEQISCSHRLNRYSISLPGPFGADENRFSSVISSISLENRLALEKNVDRIHHTFKFLSEKQNEQMYGKCNNIWGHGHNYTVEVTVRGPVDPVTGMVMNMEDLKYIMKKVVMDQMDHKNIDKQVDHFKDTISTTENIAVYIFEEIKKYISNPDLLYEVKIHETDKNVMYFRGEYLENA